MVEPTPSVAPPCVHDGVEPTFTIVEPLFTMRGTPVHDRLERAFTMKWNKCSRSRGARTVIRAKASSSAKGDRYPKRAFTIDLVQ